MRAAIAFILPFVLASVVSGCGDDPERTACTRDLDCDASHLCTADPTRAPEDLEPLPLGCGEPLLGAPPASSCAAGDECDHGICLLAGTCAAPCETEDDCDGGERCLDVFAPTGPQALQPVRACVSATDPPSGVRVTRTRVQDALEGSLSGDRLSFGRWTGSDAGLVAAIDPVTPVDAWVPHMSTRGPTPVVLFDSTGADLVKRNPPTPFGEPVTVLLPNGTDAVLSDEGYEVRVRSSASADEPVDVRLTELRRDEPGTTIDLDLFYVDIEGPSQSGDPPPAYVADALARVEAILGPAGVRVGDVRQHVVVGELADELGVLEVDTDARIADLVDLPRLFRLSAGLGRPSVPVFLVRLVEGALGISGGIPGPQGMHGTGGSGLAISVGPVRAGVGAEHDIDLGRVIAHELLHFLGLFHTTEDDGFSLEPIEDTPECPEDQDEDGTLTPMDCEEFDADNLMFWAASGEGLTPGQADVVVRGPVLR